MSQPSPSNRDFWLALLGTVLVILAMAAAYLAVPLAGAGLALWIVIGSGLAALDVYFLVRLARFLRRNGRAIWQRTRDLRAYVHTADPALLTYDDTHVPHAFELMFVLGGLIWLLVLALMIAQYVGQYQPALTAALRNVLQALQHDHGARARLGIALQTLGGLSLALDIVGEARLERWGRDLQAAAAFASGLRARLDPAFFFANRTDAERLVYLGLTALAVLGGWAAYWVTRAIAQPGAPPWGPWGAALIVFGPAGMFLTSLTKLTIRFAAAVLHFTARRLLPLRRLVAFVVLPLFLAGGLLQLWGV